MMRTACGVLLVVLGLLVPTVARAQSEQVFYYYEDAIGSVRMITDATGQVVEWHDYQPFGEESLNNPQTPQRRLYTAKERDADTNYDYSMARYYAGINGRFTTVDPGHVAGDIFNPQTWNGYAYALNNPLRYIDPDGFYARGECGSGIDVGDGCVSASDFQFWLDSQNASQGSQLAIIPQQPPLTRGLCAAGLQIARKNMAGVARAKASWPILSTAASANAIQPALLAAIGVRETNFRNVSEEDGAGVGVGIFQLTVSASSGVTAAQAGNLSWAANYAAKMLHFNETYLGRRFPAFSPSQLLQATAASYNLGPYGFSGNPDRIDVGSAGGNYGSNVVQLMNCF